MRCPSHLFLDKRGIRNFPELSSAKPWERRGAFAEPFASTRRTLAQWTRCLLREKTRGVARLSRTFSCKLALGTPQVERG